MLFQKDILLWGLLLILIPILIHLLNLRRVKKIYFTNSLFLQQYKTQKGSRTKLTKILILLIRSLSIIMLVLAFAQLFFPEKTNSYSERNLVFVVDNSISIEATNTRDRKSIDAIANSIHDILKRQPPDAQISIYTQEQPRGVKNMTPKESILEINDLNLSYIGGALKKTQDFSNSDVFVYSDFQKSEMISNKFMDSTNRYFVVPYTYRLHQNVSLDSVFLSNPINFGNESIKLKIQIKNHSDQPQLNLPLKVVIDNIQSFASTVSLEPDASITQEVTLATGTGKILKGKVEIEDYSFRADNLLHFVLTEQSRRNIYCINNSDKDYFDAVFGNDSLFNFKSTHSDEIDFGFLKKSDLIIINSPRDYSTTLIKELNRLIGTGKSLFLVPGIDPGSDKVEGLELLHQISGLKLGFPQNQDTLTFSKATSQTLLYDGVFKKSKETLEYPSVWRHLSVDGIYDKILTLENGSPILIKVLGKNIYLYLSSLKSSDFARHGLFLPTFYQLLASAENNTSAIYHHVGQDAYRMKTARSMAKKEILSVRGPISEFIPDQRLISSDEVLITLPEDVHPGFFDLISKDTLLNSFALNADRRESKLIQYTKEELEEMFKDNKNIEIFDSDDLSSVIRSAMELQDDSNFWKVLILISLFLLLLEIILLRFTK